MCEQKGQQAALANPFTSVYVTNKRTLNHVSQGRIPVLHVKKPPAYRTQWHGLRQVSDKHSGLKFTSLHPSVNGHFYPL